MFSNNKIFALCIAVVALSNGARAEKQVAETFGLLGVPGIIGAHSRRLSDEEQPTTLSKMTVPKDVAESDGNHAWWHRGAWRQLFEARAIYGFWG
ncbi:hypothetical protein PC121_g22053 [Phytophthora cactorum]|nr:hypothetical protein PC121_g22053 [Phytophthora cactorum]KAG4040377.1 hypothetical protein PC123_g24080 [Phytophthora cactorum]